MPVLMEEYKMKHARMLMTVAALTVFFSFSAAADGVVLPIILRLIESQIQELGNDVDAIHLSIDKTQEELKLLQDGQVDLDLRLSKVEDMLTLIETRKVFVTSGAFTGNLGGLDGADARCQSAADKAGLGGSYLAWLSTTSGPIVGQPASGPLHRFVRHHVPYVRPDGVRVADHFGDLVDGTLDNPINVDEFGATVFSDTGAWSSTVANGAPVGIGNPAQNTCNNWTTDDVLATASFTASIGAVDFSWSAPGISSGVQCVQRYRLICVEQ